MSVREAPSNESIFYQLTQHALDCLRREQIDASIYFASAAAYFAWREHPKTFFSWELEELLQKISQRLPLVPRREGSSLKKILHVFSETYSVGGHSRVAQRWILLDNNRQHSIVLTRQSVDKIPGFLKDAATSSGGTIFSLSEIKPIDKSIQLRKLASEYDLVILHIHPDDAVACIAFGSNFFRPILFFNHADHVFWLGQQLLASFIHFRESGADLSIKRRSLLQSQISFLPIPILETEKMPARENAREQLGLQPEQVLLLSIGSSYKFQPLKDIDFSATLLPVLNRHPNCVLWIVGPSDTPYWRELSEKTQGRVRTLGVKEDLLIYYRATDIYIDSFPFSSLTCVLEAANEEIPIISLRPSAESCGVLRSDPFGAHLAAVEINPIDSLQKQLDGLINDSKNRQEEGKKWKIICDQLYRGEGWIEALEKCYLSAISAKSNNSKALETTSELDEVLAHLHSGNENTKSINQALSIAFGNLSPSIRYIEAIYSLLKNNKPNLGRLFLEQVGRSHVQRITNRLFGKQSLL